MGILERLKRRETACTVQSGNGAHPFHAMEYYQPLRGGECDLYNSMREAVPLIDGAISKLVRLIGQFEPVCDNPVAQRELSRFVRHVAVGSGGQGMALFVWRYLEDMLVSGNGVGEMVPALDGRGIAALYNCNPRQVAIRRGACPLTVELGVMEEGGWRKAAVQELLLFTPLNPPSGEILGRSLLAGLPFVSNVLLKIYHSIGQNFERMGNLRYAVTYKPAGGTTDRAYAKEIAKNIAVQWQDTMSGTKEGIVKDFVAVGDVDIRVIGADNQVMDSTIPVRQMLEQIVAKLGIPPFMLGLSWSSTERMSTQQADILTSEMEYYRRLLSGVIVRICEMHLGLCGLWGAVDVEWDNINMQDEVELARARLLNAQAQEVERAKKASLQEGGKKID